ncbi:MAG: hypothetical protein ACLP50_33945 [Solirubrobacteraceae bacterium]
MTQGIVDGLIDPDAPTATVPSIDAAAVPAAAAAAPCEPRGIWRRRA